ncbi:hypothetical protein GQR58_005771 [Nymphon striatum]|nr:hypothetical protein GQR58_005771 [Nymphon striatum]
MDSVRSSFSQCINTNSLLHSHTVTHAEEVGFDPMTSIHAPLVNFQGWALKPKRKQTRLTPKQKRFVLDSYLEGERTGKKTTAKKVVSLMRSAKDQQGTKMFSAKDYLSREQVISQFSQFTAKQKRGEILETTDSHDSTNQQEDENIEQDDEVEELENVQESDVQAEQDNIVDELVNGLCEVNFENENSYRGHYTFSKKDTEKIEH